MNKIQDIKYYCDNYRHLICVPYSIENLHLMAEDLEIGEHFFDKGKIKYHPHYDIHSRRIEEIKSKCTIISSKELLTIIKKHIEKHEFIR